MHVYVIKVVFVSSGRSPSSLGSHELFSELYKVTESCLFNPWLHVTITRLSTTTKETPGTRAISRDCQSDRLMVKQLRARLTYKSTPRKSNTVDEECERAAPSRKIPDTSDKSVQVNSAFRALSW